MEVKAQSIFCGKQTSLQTGRPRSWGEALLTPAALHMQDQGKSQTNVGAELDWLRPLMKTATLGVSLNCVLK